MMTEINIFNELYIARADVFLALSSLVLLVIGVVSKTSVIRRVTTMGVLALGATLFMTLQQDNNNAPISLFNDMVVYDRYGVFMKSMILIASMAAIVMIVRDTAHHVFGRFESIILVLLATLGMLIMVSSNNMLSLYMGLELQSLSLYILASSNRNSLNSSEAGLKYFILGALSSGLLLFGISLIYGYTGTTSYAHISDIILLEQNVQTPMALIVGLVFVLAGLAFKISAVPFHMWTPDVYQGAPSSVTAFFATAPKIAALALIARLLFSPFAELQNDWVQIIYALSVASMAIGALGGLVQTNIYRLLAYSSIGNMGFILLGMIAGGLEGLTASMIYMAIYLITTMGIFAIILSLRNSENIAAVTLKDFSGLSKKSPIVAYGLSALLFSVAGIPPMAGFFAKLFVFKAIVVNGYYILAVIGMLASVVAAYYYLRLIKIMFFDKPIEGNDFAIRKSGLLRWVAMPCVAFVLLYIIMPDRLVYEATQAALALN